MANFKLHNNGFIYLYHWIDRKNFFRITTKMRINEHEWNRLKSRPKSPEATYNGYTITNVLVRYEGALNRALAIQPDVTKNTLGEFKKVFISILSPSNGLKKKEYNFLSYFSDYVKKIKERKQTNHKAYNTCYNYLTEYFKNSSKSFRSLKSFQKSFGMSSFFFIAN